MTNWMWSLATVLGPILLIGAIVWVTLRNRAASRRTVDRAEQSAREVRGDIDQDPEYREQ